MSPAVHRLSKRAPGFTLLEVLVVVTIIAVVAMAVLPGFREDSRLRVMAAASIIASDIEYAQVLNIAHPEDPVVVRFDPAKGQYWLADSNAPSDPIPREDTGEPYLVVLGEGRAQAAAGVTFELIDLPSDTLVFDSQGGLTDFTLQPQIVIRMLDKAITLSIAPTTGSITETDGEPQ